MKTMSWIAGAAGIVLLAPGAATADLVEKEIRRDGHGDAVDGTVYEQGSSRLSDRRTRGDRDAVISSDPSKTRVAPLREFTGGGTEATSRSDKPRFGYGSDYRDGENAAPPAGDPVPDPPTYDEDGTVPPHRYDSPSYSDPAPSYAEPRVDRPESGKRSYGDRPLPEVEPLPRGYREGDRYHEQPHPEAPDHHEIRREDFHGDPREFLHREIERFVQVLPQEFEGMRPEEIVPEILFDLTPPVHREFWPRLPRHRSRAHPVDPRCGPEIPIPFFSPPGISGHFAVPMPFPFAR